MKSRAIYFFPALLAVALVLSACKSSSGDSPSGGDDPPPGGDSGHWELVVGSLNEPHYDEGNYQLQDTASHPLLVSAGGSLYASFRNTVWPTASTSTWYSVVLKLKDSAWTQLGDQMAGNAPPDPAGLAFDSRSLAVSSSGDIYLGAIRVGLTLVMYHYNPAGATWEGLNVQGGDIGGNPVWPQLLFKGATLFLITDNWVGDYDIRAYSFDKASSMWLQVGNDKINAATISPVSMVSVKKPRMASGSDSKLHSAFIEGNKVYVKRLDGAAWVQEGASLNVDPAAYAGEVDISCVGATPYVAWREVNTLVDNQPRLFVKHFDGAKWVQDGGELNIDPAGSPSEQRIASDGARPYVAWAEFLPNTEKKVIVKHLEAGAWVQDGDSLNIVASAAANEPQIAFLGTTPYVAWCESNRMYVKRLVK